MASLKEQLHADLTARLRAGDKLETSVLRGLLAAVATEEKAGNAAESFDDVAVLRVLTAAMQKRLKVAAEYEKYAGKTSDEASKQRALEQAAAEREEAEIIKRYLPSQLTETEVEALVDAEIKKLPEVTPKAKGAVIKAVLSAADGATTGQVVSAIVNRKFS